MVEYSGSVTAVTELFLNNYSKDIDSEVIWKTIHASVTASVPANSV